MGQDRCADVQRRQLVRHGSAFARQYRGVHARGNEHKKLRIHLGSHVHPFYTEDGRRDQIRFFDYWLKGIDNGVMKEPPVKLAIRKGGNAFEWRSEHEWPLARTRWTKFYLDLSSRRKIAPA